MSEYILSSLLLIYSHYLSLLCLTAEIASGILTLILNRSIRLRTRTVLPGLLTRGIGILPALWLMFQFVKAGMRPTVGFDRPRLGRCLGVLGTIL